jgi:hypothetical protein
MGNIVSGHVSKCNENYPTERALGAVRDPGDSFSRFVLRNNPLSAGWHRARLDICSGRHGTAHSRRDIQPVHSD